MPDPMLNPAIRAQLQKMGVRPNAQAPPVLQATLEALERQWHNLREDEEDQFELLISDLVSQSLMTKGKANRWIDRLLLGDQSSGPLLSAQQLKDLSPEQCLREIVDHVASRFGELTNSFPPPPQATN